MVNLVIAGIAAIAAGLALMIAAWVLKKRKPETKLIENPFKKTN